MGFKNLYLYGMDFGFKDSGNHHASNSVYEGFMKHFDPCSQGLLTIKDIHGDDFYSTPFYYTAKRNIEIQAARNPWANLYNRSEGAEIQGTQVLSQYCPPIDVSAEDKAELLKCMHQTVAPPKDFISRVDERFVPQMDHVLSFTQHMIEHMALKEADLIFTCQNISWEIEKLLNINKGVYFFIRGTIWHLLYIAYTNHFCEPDAKQRVHQMIQWKKFSKQWIQQLKEDIHFRTSQDYLKRLPAEITPRLG